MLLLFAKLHQALLISLLNKCFIKEANKEHKYLHFIKSEWNSAFQQMPPVSIGLQITVWCSTRKDTVFLRHSLLLIEITPNVFHYFPSSRQMSEDGMKREISDLQIIKKDPPIFFSTALSFSVGKDFTSFYASLQK